MDYKGHVLVAGGIAAFLLVVFFPSAGLAESLLLLLVCCASSLVPDLDHPKSFASRLLNLVAIFSFTAVTIAILLSTGSCQSAGLAFLAISASWLVFSSLARPRHRGITHTVIFSIFYAIAILLSSQSATLGLFSLAGFLSHLAADLQFKLT